LIIEQEETMSKETDKQITVMNPSNTKKRKLNEMLNLEPDERDVKRQNLSIPFRVIKPLTDDQKEMMRKDPEMKDLEKKQKQFWYYTIDELIEVVHKIFGQDGYSVEYGIPIKQFTQFVSDKDQYLACYSVHCTVYFNDGTFYQANGLHTLQQGGNLGLSFFSKI